MEIENSQFKQLFKALQDSKNNGGIIIADLSSLVNIPVEEIEDYYWGGKLGTAGAMLKFECRKCSVLISEFTRRGRYCVNCSDEVSEEAGVRVKSRQQIEKDDKFQEERAKEVQQLELSRKAKQINNLSDKKPRNSGFIRNW